MLFYVDEISIRLVYTLDFVFKEHGLEYQLTNDKSFFTASGGVRISYSDYEFEDIPILRPSGLLFEEQIREGVLVEKGTWNGVQCLQLDHISDPLASIFYVLSRYEEYYPVFLDHHGRFTAEQSIQHKYGWLKRQIVEHWVESFLDHFAPEYLVVLKEQRSVRVIPSFDIDNTFAFKWKEGWRSWLSNGKDLLTNNRERLKLRKLVQNGELKDPFDSFDVIRSVLKSYPDARVFWHLGNYGKYDTNLAWSDPRHQSMIREISDLGHVGLHPSYLSNDSDERLLSESERVNLITAKNITESRQHFLKLNLPKTYNRMRELGFEKDYTMGYADEVGFRAGTAYEHSFFDLLTNKAHPEYRIVPFVYMDGTLLEYKKLTIEESLKLIDQLVEEVKRYGGVFCFIWHNETIAEAGKWKGWKAVFDHTLKQLK